MGGGDRFNQQPGSDFDALVSQIIISRGDGINDHLKVFAEGNLIFLVKDLRYVCSLISLLFLRFNSIEFINYFIFPYWTQVSGIFMLIQGTCYSYLDLHHIVKTVIVLLLQLPLDRYF